MRNEPQFSCTQLSNKILSAMEADGYSYTTTRRKYNYILREIAKYCDNNFGGIYTTEAGDEYLQQKTLLRLHMHLNGLGCAETRSSG